MFCHRGAEHPGLHHRERRRAPRHRAGVRADAQLAVARATAPRRSSGCSTSCRGCSPWRSSRCCGGCCSAPTASSTTCWARSASRTARRSGSPTRRPRSLAVTFINIWSGYPFFMITLLAGSAGHPDGPLRGRHESTAPAWSRSSATSPSRSCGRSSSAMALLDFIWTTQQFALIWMTTGGGPINVTEVLCTFTYKLAFTQYEFSVASAGRRPRPADVDGARVLLRPAPEGEGLSHDHVDHPVITTTPALRVPPKQPARRPCSSWP